MIRLSRANRTDAIYYTRARRCVYNSNNNNMFYCTREPAEVEQLWAARARDNVVPIACPGRARRTKTYYYRAVCRRWGWSEKKKKRNK